MFQNFDSITFNHSCRVMTLAKEYERSLGIEPYTGLITKAALVHDIGKTYISSSILDKRDMLQPAERELIDLHAYFGYEILKSYKVDDTICKMVLFHHSDTPGKINGVFTIKDDEILELAKKLHTLDAFEALTSDRPYHRHISAVRAINMLRTDDRADVDVINFLDAKVIKDEYDDLHELVSNDCIKSMMSEIVNSANTSKIHAIYRVGRLEACTVI